MHPHYWPCVGARQPPGIALIANVTPVRCELPTECSQLFEQLNVLRATRMTPGYLPVGMPRSQQHGLFDATIELSWWQRWTEHSRETDRIDGQQLNPRVIDMSCSSVLKKRKLKMNKHKHRKRRKQNRHKTR
jgi:hypothetical protein